MHNFRQLGFKNVILADKPFTKALRIFETCVSNDNSLCEKLVSSLDLLIKFDERFKVASVPYFTVEFNLLSCEFLHLT